MRLSFLIPALFALAACTEGMPLFAPTGPEEPGDADAPLSAIDASLIAPPPDQAARTADEFDTTTEEQRAAATAIEVADISLIGKTVASLGDPTNPGFWLETPLVDTLTAGAVVNPASGARVAVDLRPIAAPPGSGSRISLAALRALGGSLTDLLTVEVFRN